MSFSIILVLFFYGDDYLEGKFVRHISQKPGDTNFTCIKCW